MARIDHRLLDSLGPLTPIEDQQRQRKALDLSNQQREQNIATGAQRKELNDLEISHRKFKGLSERDRLRFESSVRGMQQLQPFLANNDTQGALSFLERRRGQLNELGIDTNETDEMMQAIIDDPQASLSFVNDSLAMANRMGIGSKNNDPATVKIANELRKAREARDQQRVNDLLTVHKSIQLEKGQRLDPNTGAVSNLPNFEQSVQSVNRAEATGRKEVELEFNPQIRSSVVEAEGRSERSNEAQEKISSIRTSIDDMVTDIDSLLDDPALNDIVGGFDALTLDLRGGSRRAANLLNKIVSKSVLEAASALKGTLSDSDILLLRQSANDLDRSLTEEDFRNNAIKFKRRLLRTLSIAESKANEASASNDADATDDEILQALKERGLE